MSGCLFIIDRHVPVTEVLNLATTPLLEDYFPNQGEMDMNMGVRFTGEFERHAGAQIVERDYAVSEVLNA